MAAPMPEVEPVTSATGDAIFMLLTWVTVVKHSAPFDALETDPRNRKWIRHCLLDDNTLVTKRHSFACRRPGPQESALRGKAAVRMCR